MSVMTYKEAIKEGMSIRMRENSNIIMFGEDVGEFGGVFGVTKGMIDEFGSERILDTPISETAIVGSAIGAATTGLRPIAEIMYCDFVTVAMDQLANQAAKMRFMFGGKISLPMVVRMACGAGASAAAQHAQSTEAWLTHVPGLKIVFPSTPQDALGLMLSAIDDDNPVVYMDHKMLYTSKGNVSSFEPIPLGKGDIKREGKDVTVIATGKMVHEALKAADTMKNESVDVEVLDPRTLFPLDKELISKSVNKTNKVVIITEENRRGAYSESISSFINEELFDMLDAPVMRIGALNTPVPFAPVLEKLYIPNAQDIINNIRKIV
ncbi:alpha-ketoacid dehydrogenase subunit beta [Megasphaera sueciensis]|uniref:alpha-ketoacid dehydrogenase subunit beta n=1 Tax=Megasphaera sueciensis TaxID=349094 RepID=UPI003D03C8E4